MKNKVLIAVFFVIMMLMIPCASAFEMPLSKEDKKDLEVLINNENANNQQTLNGIITSNITLDLDEIESIYENFFLTGDDSVINSDPWMWIVNRLGWVYISVEHVISLYNTGLALYYEILKGASAVQYFLDSIISFRASWQAFKANPFNFETIKNLLLSTIDVLKAAINVLEYATSNAVEEVIQAFADDVQGFIDFLQSNPWHQPITIKGNVIGFDESVTIQVKSDSVTTTGYYELEYTTVDANIPWFVHKCVITASYQSKTNTKNRYAFSMGIIEEDYTTNDFKTKSKYLEKPVFMRLGYIFEKLLDFIFFVFLKV